MVFTGQTGNEAHTPSSTINPDSGRRSRRHSPETAALDAHSLSVQRNSNSSSQKEREKVGKKEKRFGFWRTSWSLLVAGVLCSCSDVVATCLSKEKEKKKAWFLRHHPLGSPRLGGVAVCLSVRVRLNPSRNEEAWVAAALPSSPGMAFSWGEMLFLLCP